jgi:hypothetical protein
MTGITSSSRSTPATIEQLEVPRAMISAMEPYRVASQLVSIYGKGADSLLNEDDLLRVNDKKRLLCLQNLETMTDPIERNYEGWRLNRSAKGVLRELPALPDVQAVLDAVRLDLDTEPPLESRVELIGGLLDVQGIAPDLKYIQILAWKLGDCPPRKTETRKRNKPGFSLVTIARTVDEIWTTLRPEYGRPVPITDVLDIAGRHASEMIELRRSTFNIGKAIVGLQKIVHATQLAKVPGTSEPCGTAIDCDDETTELGKDGS